MDEKSLLEKVKYLLAFAITIAIFISIKGNSIKNLGNTLMAASKQNHAVNIYLDKTESLDNDYDEIDIAESNNYDCQISYLNLNSDNVALIQAKDKTILVDACDYASYVELTTLLSENTVTSIDALFITKFDDTYKDTVIQLMSEFNIPTLYIQNLEDSRYYEDYNEIISDSTTQGFAVINPNIGQDISVGDINFKTLAINNNNSSLVLQMTYCGHNYMILNKVSSIVAASMLDDISNINILFINDYDEFNSYNTDFIESLSPSYMVVNSPKYYGTNVLEEDIGSDIPHTINLHNYKQFNITYTDGAISYKATKGQ